MPVITTKQKFQIWFREEESWVVIINKVYYGDSDNSYGLPNIWATAYRYGMGYKGDGEIINLGAAIRAKLLEEWKEIFRSDGSIEKQWNYVLKSPIYDSKENKLK